MCATFFDGGGQRQHIIALIAVILTCFTIDRPQFSDDRLAFGQGPGFVEGNGADTAQRLQICAAFNEDTASGRGGDG